MAITPAFGYGFTKSLQSQQPSTMLKQLLMGSEPDPQGPEQLSGPPEDVMQPQGQSGLKAKMMGMFGKGSGGGGGGGLLSLLSMFGGA